MSTYILIFLTLSFIGPSEQGVLKIDKVWKTPYSFATLSDCSELASSFNRKGMVTDCLKVDLEDIGTE